MPKGIEQSMENKIITTIISEERKYSKTPDCPVDMPLTIVCNAKKLAIRILDIISQAPKCSECGGVGKNYKSGYDEPCGFCNGTGQATKEVNGWPDKCKLENWMKQCDLDNITGYNQALDDCSKVHESVVANKDREILEFKKLLGWNEKEQVIARSKGLNSTYDYTKEVIRYKDNRIAELKNCLLELKHHNNHTIEEEVWRIDKVLGELK